MKCLRKLFPFKEPRENREKGHFEKLCGPFARAVDEDCAAAGIKSFPENVHARDIFNLKGAYWGMGIEFFTVDHKGEIVESVIFKSPLTVDPEIRHERLREAAVSIGATI